MKVLERAGNQKGGPKPMALGYSWRECQRWFAAYREAIEARYIASWQHTCA